MNPSKSTVVRICKRYLPYVLIYLVGLGILLYAYRGIMVLPLKYDAAGYAKQIETGAISSWWSALFMYECRFILQLLRFIFGGCIRVELSIYLVYSVCICTMIAAMRMVMKMIENRGGKVIVPACIMCACAALAYLFGAPGPHNIALLDTPGSALLFSAAVCTLGIHRGMGAKKLCVRLFLVVILMIHACSYRTPFLMVAPVMGLYLGYVLARKRTWSGVIVRGGLMCVAFYACVVLTNHALPPYEHSTGTMSPMFGSDMKISAILEGDGYFIDRLAEEHSLELSTDEAVVGCFQLISADYGIMRGKGAGAVLREAYIQRWREKPGLMAEARLIQMFHFLTGGYTPEWFKRLLALRHPHMDAPGMISDRFKWPDNPPGFTLRYMLALLVCLCGTALPLLTLLSKRGRQGGFSPMLLYLSALCVSSMACYLIIVVPTPDFRYRIQALLLSGLALSMVWSVISSRLAVDDENA